MRTRFFLIVFAGMATAALVFMGPVIHLLPQAPALSGEPCDRLPFDQVRNLTFGPGDATDRGKAVAVRQEREDRGLRCRGILDRLDCTAPGPTRLMLYSHQTVAYFAVPDGRSARIRLHRAVASCVLNPVTAPRASG